MRLFVLGIILLTIDDVSIEFAARSRSIITSAIVNIVRKYAYKPLSAAAREGEASMWVVWSVRSPSSITHRRGAGSCDATARTGTGGAWFRPWQWMKRSEIKRSGAGQELSVPAGDVSRAFCAVINPTARPGVDGQTAVCRCMSYYAVWNRTDVMRRGLGLIVVSS